MQTAIFIFNVVFLPYYIHTRPCARAWLKLWYMLEFLKYNSSISLSVAFVYVSGGERTHFSKKRNFILIILNPCGQEWPSGRLET